MLAERKSPPAWNAIEARSLSTAALLSPLLGAYLYHAHDMTILGRVLIGICAPSMLLMPLMFKEALNMVFKCTGKDELQESWHNEARRKSYWLIVIIAWVLLVGAGVASKFMTSIEDVRHLLMTFSMILIAYAFVVPFSFLAWSITPLDEE